MGSKGVDGVPHMNGNLTNGDAHNSKGTHSRNQSSYAANFNLAAHFIGGNHLGAAPAGRVKDFVANHDGHTVITNVSSEL
jgi:acetyl-CoA carboxylase/biotin carboxylase 1